MKIYKRTRPHYDRLPDIAKVETYMKSKGWHKMESENPNAFIYQGPPDIYGKPLIAVLPSRADLIDAEPRLKAVLSTLATIEAQSLRATVREIKAF